MRSICFQRSGFINDLSTHKTNAPQQVAETQVCAQSIQPRVHLQPAEPIGALLDSLVEPTARVSVTHVGLTLTGRAFDRSLKQLIHFSPSLRLHYGSPLALNSILVVWRQSAARSPHPQTPNRSDKPASKSSPSS